MNFAEELKDRASQAQAKRPLWFQPEHADTVILTASDDYLNKDVSAIVVHAALTEMKGVGLVAHFRIFLQLPQEKSIELNSSGLQHIKTRLQILSRPFPFSVTTSFMGVHKIPVEGPVTALDLVKTLLINNRDRYVLDTATGSGCLYWCCTVINDFIKKGWVLKKHADCVEQLAATVKADEKYKNVMIPIPGPKGTFY